VKKQAVETRSPCFVFLLRVAGRYGNQVGWPNATCAGPASPGYYTLNGATNDTQYACPAVSQLERDVVLLLALLV
jgi:hypothetical protein